jgi:4-hydroxy-tetrahydrodipicolinate synthase
MDKEKLGGFVPAVVTPFAANGEIMEDAFRHIVDWLIGNGATAICVAGDNGESWTLSPDERGRLTRLAREAARGRAAVMTGVTAPTLAQTLVYARAAEANGAEALLAMPPTYVLKGSREEIVRRYAGIAQTVKLPIVAYNSLRRVGYSMTPDDLGAALNAAPIIGIKESERDFFNLTNLIERFRDKLAIMVGPCHFILPGVALGAKGFISTGPEFLGRDAGRLVEIGQAKPGAEYRAIHYKLTAVYQLLMGTGTWPAAFKAALNLIGQPAGIPRDPVLPLTGEALDKVRRTLAELGIETVRQAA